MPEQTRVTPRDDIIDALIAISLLTRHIAQTLAHTTDMKGAKENGENERPVWCPERNL